MSEQERKEHRCKWLFLILCLLGLLLGLIGLFRFCTYTPEHDYPLLEQDLNSQRLPSDDDSGESSEVMIQVGQEVKVWLNDDYVELYYANPASNDVGARVSLVIDGETVAQSGLVEPGYYLERIDGVLYDGLSYGEQDGVLVIDTYDLDTGERKMVNNEVSVTVSVAA